jgi:hypothetical protein
MMPADNRESPRSSRRRPGVQDQLTSQDELRIAQDLKNGIARLFGGVGETKQEANGPSSYQMPVFPTQPASGRSGMAGMAMDKHGRVQMGVSNPTCDDGKTNLTMDWDFSPVNYTCFHPETRFPLEPNLSPLWECDFVPKDYNPAHFCMDQQISYKEDIPKLGDHRPLWPVYGEYLFVPTQRWLHNIEHGALIMLYHPCAHPEEVKHLRSLVTSCFDKHVITPSTLVPPERPFALVAWGCRLLMARVDEELVVKFIHEKVNKGPEDTKKEGQYSFGLIHAANEKGTAQYNVIKCGQDGQTQTMK